MPQESSLRGRRTTSAQEVCLQKEGQHAKDSIIKAGAEPAGRDRRGRGRCCSAIRSLPVDTRHRSWSRPTSDIARLDPHDDVVRGVPHQGRGLQHRVDRRARSTSGRRSRSRPRCRAAHPEHWVLVVRKPLDTVNAAVSTVRRAFVYAALAGLALTLLLGIPLSATIVRRLRRLRHAALQLAARRASGRGSRRPPPRRGRRPGPRVRPDAAAAPAAGGGAPSVRLDRLARAAHAAGLARRDARAARRRSGQRRSRPRRRAVAARTRADAIAPAGAAGGGSARPEPARRAGPAALRAGRARRAEPRRAGRVRAGDRGARHRLDARRRRRPGVGARRSGRDRADRPDPARQRGPRQPPGRRDHRRAAQRRARRRSPSATRVPG